MLSQGPSLENDILKELCELLEIKKTRTSIRIPKGNGQCERFNRTFLGMIKSFIKGEQTEWDQNLGCLAGTYGATPNESTTLTPNLMLIGKEIRLQDELLKGGIPLVNNENISRNFGEHATKIRQSLQKAQKVAREHLQANAKRIKNYYDRKSKLNIFVKNDKVWYLSGPQKGTSPKLQTMYTVPCVITKRFNNINYEIHIDENGVNHDRLKQYMAEDTAKWIKSLIKKL